MAIVHLTAQQTVTFDGIEYSLSGTNATIIKVTTTAKELTLPSTISVDGSVYDVTILRGGSFVDCTSLESLTIPGSIIEISGDGNLFTNCPALTSITFAESSTSLDINGVCFWDRGTSLRYLAILRQFNNPFYMSLLSAEASLDCLTLGDTRIDGLFNYEPTIKKVVITEGVTEINCTFGNVKGLESISLPEGLLSIGPKSFRGCSNLREINIPGTVESIMHDAFCDCKSLPFIGLNLGLKEIGERAFSGCISLEGVTIPEEVTYIGPVAFKGCVGLHSISIPSSVNFIGPDAFEGCDGLREFVIEESETPITICHSNSSNNSPRSLIGGPNVSSLTILRQIENEDSWLYPTSFLSSSENLKEVVLGGSLEKIWDGAFWNATSLKSIVIPVEVTSIGISAFYGCSAIKELTIPENVTTIGYGAFQGCTGLQHIVIEQGSTPLKFDTWEADGPRLFNGDNLESLTILRELDCSRQTGILLNSQSLKSLTLGDGFTDVWNNSFSNLSSLQTLELLEGVEAIGDYIFYGSKNLKSISFPSTLKSIGSYAFMLCMALQEIELPHGLLQIGWEAFAYCSNLSSVNIPSTLSEIGDSWFYGCSNLEHIVIPETVANIASSAFRDCSNLRSVELPKELVNIGNFAFAGCSNLKSIQLTEGLIEIGNYAFKGCELEGSLNIPTSIKSIGKGAFIGNNFSKLTIDQSEEPLRIGEGLLGGTTNFLYIGRQLSFSYDAAAGPALINAEIVEMTDAIEEIQDHLFYRNSILKSITLSPNVKSIGDYSFYECENLKEIIIPDKVENIGSSAFVDCTSLEEVTLPASVKEIGAHAFDGCYLSTVTSLSPVPPVISPTSFIDYVYVSADLNVPEGSEEAYSKADGWKLFKKLTGTVEPDPVEPTAPITLTLNIAAGELADLIANGDLPNVVSLTLTGEINGTDLGVINSLVNLETLDLSGAHIVSGGQPYYEVGGKKYRTHNGMLEQYWLHGVSPKNVELPQVSTIGAAACSGMSFDRLILPLSVTKIEDDAFSDCRNLAYVDIPDSVTTVGDGAFYGCSNLSEVSLGYSVGRVGRDAFAGSALQTLWVWSPVPPTISEDTFDEMTYVAANLHVYEPFKEKYNQNSYWRKFEHMSGEQVTFPVISITISAPSTILDLRTTVQLTAKLNPQFPSIDLIEWKSTNPKVARVSSTGLVTALSEGETEISAAALDGSGTVGSIIIHVVDPTGIESINADNLESNAIIYDLSGRRLRRISDPGIYIINGTKVRIIK